ncbi:hypothetical protein F5Y17DRAFT_325005 [Xylariaceae sp. FL0594]|nr:hypothetical protein F5Y17DRAFT_325005 [Xylariaceae sp. FL0594]
MSVDETNPTGCPESGLSPKTQTTQPTPEKHDYFSLTKKRRSNAAGHVQAKTSMSTPKATGANNPNIVLDLGARVRETDNTGDASASTPGETTSSSSSSAHDSRKGSLTNITFLTPTNPSLPRGQKKPHGGSRIRDASPPHRSGPHREAS